MSLQRLQFLMDHKLSLGSNIPTTSNSETFLVFFLWEFQRRPLLRMNNHTLGITGLRHVQSFVVAFIEQVENIEKSKASVVEVVLCFVTVKARIQEIQSDVHIKPSYISTKEIQRRQGSWLWFIHVRCSCIVKVCVSHLAEWTGSLYLLNLNALTRFFGLQTTNWEKMKYVSNVCLIEKFLLMKLQ